MFGEALRRFEDEGLLRELRRIDSPQGPRVLYRRREYILLSSNNYLGLANHPRIIEAAQEAMKQFGVGAGASRLLSGNMSLHERLEEAIAWLRGTETSLLFNSGYTAGTSILPALAGRGDAVYLDRLSHASLVDGAVLSRARLLRYRHRDTGHLETLLSKGSFRRRVIVTEGVFSMDGDIAPIPALLELAERYDALLLVDDAHGTAVLGKKGQGTLEHFGIEGTHPRVIQIGTLGKAVGTFGAYAACDLELKRYLINTARGLIYSTALPIPVLAASFAAIKLIGEQPHLREDLWKNRDYFYLGLRKMGFDTLESETPIIPIRIGDPKTASQFSKGLMDEGVFAPAIRPPTVPRGTSRIRTSVMATHAPEDLESALTAFQKVGRAMGLL
jgi:8-amino-7-oxononanoate synthase